VTPEDGYLLDNRQREAGQRFDALAELLDPWTFRHLDALGVSAGWRCLEIGAGGPSVPSWLATRVGPSGRVLATDIDTSWMPGKEGRSYDVLRHDVGTEPLPDNGFDLIHARLVLVHVPTRDEVVGRLVAALRPGGWLLLEDADPALQPLLCPDESGPEQELANRLRHGFRTLLAQRGAELGYGRTLPRVLRAAGLQEVMADAYFPITSPACTALEIATVEQIRGRLVTGGIASDEEIDEHLANVRRGDLDLATAPLISAWGRRPA
jgi:Methyltransferase domain